MSPIGKLLRGIRLKKNISELKAARRCDISIEDYNAYENNPEKVSGKLLYKIFQAIEISEDEYIDFNTLTTKFLDEGSQNVRNFNLKEHKESDCTILEFTDKAGIKKAKKTQIKKGGNNERK